MREHSAAELRRKLARNHSRELVDQVLERLARDGLQSDARYAEHYVASRVAKGYGPRRIERELQEKGVPGDLIHSFLDARQEDWSELMLKLARRKYGHGPAPDQKELARRGRFLEQRGFPHHLIRDYLYGAGEDIA